MVGEEEFKYHLKRVGRGKNALGRSESIVTSVLPSVVYKALLGSVYADLSRIKKVCGRECGTRNQ